MKTSIYHYFCLLFIPLCLQFLTSCEGKQDEAEKLLSEIRQAYEEGNYEAALRGVDSLRHAYPDALKPRTEALKIHQQASLKMAQETLAKVDSALMVAQGEYEAIRPVIDEKHKQGIATPQELDHLNRLRVHRDSLQVSFDVECARIKYIMKRMKEQ